MKKFLKEQKITSFSPEANAHRNMRRPKVDKLFSIKNSKKKKKDRMKFDMIARQLWRRIVQEANKL